MKLTTAHAAYLNGEGITEPVYIPICESITDVSQLPPGILRWTFEERGPGIAFHHTRPDGSTAIQFRPDAKPEDGKRKYVFEDGAGSVLAVHPLMRDRMDQATRLVIVEGTKQGLSGVSYAQPDDLVVSIQGCWSWSSEGLPADGWDDLILKGRPVVVSFDADWTTKRTVWDAAERLSRVLESLGAGTVTYVRIPASADTGLDDYLKGRPRAKRQDVFANLLEMAKPKLGRRPAAERKRPEQLTSTVAGLAPVVDVTTGVIREADSIRYDDTGATQVTGDVLLEAAVVVHQTIVVRDDMRRDRLPDIQHDLDVYIGPDANPIRIAAIPDTMLGDVEAILRRDPSGRGTRVVRRPGRGVTDSIAAGIRATAADAEIVTAYRRTGWVTLEDGTRGYLHAGGCLTAAGNLEWPRAETSYNRIDLSEAAERAQDPAQLTEAVDRVVQIPSMLPDAAGYYAGLGGLAYAATGNAPRGGVYLIGGKGSGKTTVARVVASFLTPDYAPESEFSMVSMQSSQTTISEAGAGLQHCLCMVDDVRLGTSRREQERMMTGIDSVMRRAYEGGAVGRTRQVWDSKAGTLRSVESDPTSPFMLMVGEVLPSAEQFGSSVERVVTVPFTARQEGEPDLMDLDSLHWVSQSGMAATAFAGYIMWLAARPGAAERALDTRTRMTSLMVERHPSLTTRAASVGCGPIAGWHMWCDYLLDTMRLQYPRHPHLAVGYASDTRRAGVKSLVTATLRHSQVEMSASLSPHARVLSKLAEVVSSGGRFKLLGTDDQGRDLNPKPGDEAIGRRTTVTDREGAKVNVIALLPAMVAKAVREPSGEAVTRALRAVAIVGPDGQTARTMRIGGTMTRAVCIPSELWDGVADPTEAPAPVLSVVPADF